MKLLLLALALLPAVALAATDHRAAPAPAPQAHRPTSFQPVSRGYEAYRPAPRVGYRGFVPAPAFYGSYYAGYGAYGYASSYYPVVCAPEIIYVNPGYGSYVPAPEPAAWGVVVSLRAVYRAQPSPAGTLVGAVAGGVIGHNIAEGRGRTGATVLGALIGAVVGGQVAPAVGPSGQEALVRLASGQMIYCSFGGVVRTGDRVLVRWDSGTPWAVRS